MEKLEIENRIKELDNLLAQQDQFQRQVGNNILMIHGAKQELDLWLKKINEKEKAEAEAPKEPEAPAA